MAPSPTDVCGDVQNPDDVCKINRGIRAGMKSTPFSAGPDGAEETQ